jgi:hypothetical protein
MPRFVAVFSLQQKEQKVLQLQCPVTPPFSIEKEGEVGPEMGG